MSLEIERKFLVEKDAIWSIATECGQGTRIEQFYLVLGTDPEVRIRNSNGENQLTVKFGSGLVREEIEFPLDSAVALALMAQAKTMVVKTRFTYENDGELWEFDVYPTGLITAEMEVESEDVDVLQFVPDWLKPFTMTDVTGDVAYSNQALAKAVTK